MSDIFISYSSKDRARAKVLAGALEHQGWSVWWDRKIPPGRQFSQVIKEAMDEARCIIVLWSKESVKSEWVQNEAAEGARRKILVPALIDDVEIPFEFRRIQAARLVDWEGRSPHPEFDTLLEALCAILGQPLLPKASEPIPDEQQPVNEIHTLAEDKPKDDRPMDITISKEPKKPYTNKVLAAICIVTLIAIISTGIFLKYRQRTGPQRRADITPMDKTPATAEKPEPPTEVEPIQQEEKGKQSVDVSRRAPIADGLYVITSVSSKKSLDINSLIPEVGANVIQCNYSGNPTQQWSLQHVDRGYYRIMAGNSETICLEVVEDGTNVHLNDWKDTDNDNQKWALESAGEDCYKIIAGQSGKCLDIDGSSERAIQNTGSDSDSQRWQLRPAEQSWIGNITVTMKDTLPQGKGWEKSPVDLNEGVWLSPAIWLWVRGPARNNIRVTSSKDPNPEGPGEGWEKIDVNLNEGRKAKYIYLWVRGPARNNIKVLEGMETKWKGPPGKGWEQIGPDLNEGAWGKYLYLWVR